ncbi:MAG: alanine--tRNA ligase, partial [Nitrospinae bacterium]|nr:alanine--tRNA ligase [Nitrospinota bacterium]
MTGNELRRIFLDYFKRMDHKILPSSSLIPRDDPTLLFTNAGMVQFKDLFLGKVKRDYVRAATSQKCVRAGGKHNDLEVVGRTARHHTFFEMLGNFSFGDYFKELAIEMGWEFLTEVIKLPKERLWITIFKDDDEALNIWNKKIGVPTDRIVRLGKEHNFWSMGESGPCGPCSEIIIDQGEDIGCGEVTCSVGCDCDRYLELWNLVFMEFNREEDGKTTPLPNPSIDTGMGLERLSAVVQGVKSNYESDLIRPIITYIEEITGKGYGENRREDISLCVIADHIRAITFLISDGVFPSNEGRGYVLRRILRRASRHSKMLGQDNPILYRIVGPVVDVMKVGYPEIVDNKEHISMTILAEEERFSSTLNQGMKILDDLIQRIKDKGESEIPGNEVFKLYDTYGFPVDLTDEIVRENGLSIDMDGFNSAMKGQREKARASWKGAGGVEGGNIYKEIIDNIGETIFTGYDCIEGEARITAIIKEERLIESASEGEDVGLIVDKTPFYGEGGGQVGDQGRITNGGVLIDIIDTNRPLPAIFVHVGRIRGGEIKKGDRVYTKINEKRRRAIALNHTATHLLHFALRQVLGDYVKQSGSLVADDKLRFDYTHFSPTTTRERKRIEELVNEKIRSNQRVDISVMDLEDAIDRGAIALFGEKYGEKVRVVTISDYSKELCAGTHTKATGDIGLFRIVYEGGVAAGVRRIEAVTGHIAYKEMKKEEERLLEIQELLKARPSEESLKIRRLLEKIKGLERELEGVRDKMISTRAGDWINKVRKINGINVLTERMENLDMRSLRSFVDSAKVKLGSGVIVAGTTVMDNNEVSLAAGVTDDLIDRFSAGEIIREVAGIVDGSGGGRADMAQAGGRDPSKLDKALERVYEIVEE